MTGWPGNLDEDSGYGYYVSPPDRKGNPKKIKKYIILVNSSEQSRKVQHILFYSGFKWEDDKYGGQHLKHLGIPFLYLNHKEVGTIICSSNFKGVAINISNGYIPLHAEDIISNPYQLDGAELPEQTIMIHGKEIAMPIIQAALIMMGINVYNLPYPPNQEEER